MVQLLDSSELAKLIKIRVILCLLEEQKSYVSVQSLSVRNIETLIEIQHHLR
jgi:hypothetical protein